MTGNTGRSWTQAQSGSVSNAGTAVGTNCAQHHHHELHDPGRAVALRSLGSTASTEGAEGGELPGRST